MSRIEKVVDWDKGLPSDVLALVAKGESEMKAMREVSKNWKSGFEKSVTRLKLATSEPPALFSGDALAQRFPGLTSLDLGAFTSEEAARRSKAVPGLKKLKTLRLGISERPPCLTAAVLPQLLQPGRAFIPNLGPSLTSLDLQGLPLAGYFLEHLKGMRLTSLSLRKTLSIVDEDLEHLREMPLTHLDLWGNRVVTGDGLRFLQGLPLTHISLGYCTDIFKSAQALGPLMGLPIVSLDLSGNIRLSDEHLRSLEGLPLTSLNLKWCSNLTGDGLEHLSRMPLKYLNLTDCSRIRRAGLEHLVAAPLVRVCLHGCWSVSAGARAALKERGVIVEGDRFPCCSLCCCIC